VVVNDVGRSLDGSGGSELAADSVVNEIRSSGGTAVASYDSVAEPESAQALIDRALNAFGRVDILVNNAGILRDKSFGKMSMSDFDAVTGVHLHGAAYCTHAAWPVMAEQKYGRVIFTLSNAGLYGNFGQANYAAGKTGLIGLMNALKIEGLRKNILVNAVAPMAATRMTEATFAPELIPRFQPEYVSAAIAWMCSDNFNETGTIISCAAGHYAAVRIMSSRGVTLRGAATPESVAAEWQGICDMSDSRNFDSAQEEVAFVAERVLAD
jgi:NAD(P)-dependent dehydrogenase (short-subunit alcohol dehydrogenase family)